MVSSEAFRSQRIFKNLRTKISTVMMPKFYLANNSNNLVSGKTSAEASRRASLALPTLQARLLKFLCQLDRSSLPSTRQSLPPLDKQLIWLRDSPTRFLGSNWCSFPMRNSCNLVSGKILAEASRRASLALPTSHQRPPRSLYLSAKSSLLSTLLSLQPPVRLLTWPKVSQMRSSTSNWWT